MDIRYPANPQDFETYTTERIRSEFLIQNLFTPGRLALTYSHADRMIVGGACHSSRGRKGDGLRFVFRTT